MGGLGRIRGSRRQTVPRLHRLVIICKWLHGILAHFLSCPSPGVSMLLVHYLHSVIKTLPFLTLWFTPCAMRYAGRRWWIHRWIIFLNLPITADHTRYSIYMYQKRIVNFGNSFYHKVNLRFNNRYIFWQNLKLGWYSTYGFKWEDYEFMMLSNGLWS